MVKFVDEFEPLNRFEMTVDLNNCGFVKLCVIVAWIFSEVS